MSTQAAPGATTIARRALLALAAASLAAGIAGGLMRLGIVLPLPAAPAAVHGALMIGGFLATVIALERAIALGSPLALCVPLASGAAGLALLAGGDSIARALLLAASLLLVAVSLAILRRQRAEHTFVLALAALAWAAGNALYARQGSVQATLPWWFAFLVLTVAAERLELTRLMRRRPVARPMFHAIVALLLAAAAAAGTVPGDALFGIALVALAAWLATFDLARRTLHAEGYARYAAVALLAGYGWLAVGGTAWAWQALPGGPVRDAALHALGVGFVLSMIFAHAPLIVPVIACARVRYTPRFYLPLALLHGSLLLRLGPGIADVGARQWGGLFNVAALLWFAAVLVHTTRRPAGEPFPSTTTRGEHP